MGIFLASQSSGTSFALIGVWEIENLSPGAKGRSSSCPEEMLGKNSNTANSGNDVQRPFMTPPPGSSLGSALPMVRCKTHIQSRQKLNLRRCRFSYEGG